MKSFKELKGLKLPAHRKYLEQAERYQEEYNVGGIDSHTYILLLQDIESLLKLERLKLKVKEQSEMQRALDIFALVITQATKAVL